MGAQNIYYNDLDFSISIESLASLSSPRAKQNFEPFIRQTDEKSRKHWNCPNTIKTRTNKTIRLGSMAISESLALHTARVIAHHSDRPQASQSAGLALITCREARPSPVTGTVFRMRDKFTRIQPSLASSSSQIMLGWLRENGEWRGWVTTDTVKNMYSGPDPRGPIVISCPWCPCLFCLARAGDPQCPPGAGSVSAKWPTRTRTRLYLWSYSVFSVSPDSSKSSVTARYR